MARQGNPACPGSIAIWLVTFLLVQLAGCASTDTSAQPSTFDTRTLDYRGVVLEFVRPAAGSQEVDLAGAGEGMAEGAKMMVAAPVECLRGADPFTAAFCIGLAPFFPFLSAARVQDQEISLRQLDTLYRHIEALEVHQQFRDEVEWQARDAGVQLAEHSTDGMARLRARLGPVSLVHDGYEGGEISMAIPYDFDLLSPDSEIVTTVSGQLNDEFDVDTWQIDSDPDRSILHWVRFAAARGLRLTLTEWQPELVLGPVDPAPVRKRNIIGIMQDRWPDLATLRPRLRWQPLEDVLDPELLEQVSDISYELRIAGRYSDETHYYVRDLSEPSHQLDDDLEPCAVYVWQPRARFRYRDNLYTTSLRKRQWSRDVWITDNYPLYTPGPKCKNPRPV